MNKTNAVIMIAGVECCQGKENEFNHWYNNKFPQMMLNAPGVIKVERYQRMEEDTRMPKFISIVYLENEGSIQSVTSSEAVKELAAIYLDESTQWDLQIRWAGNYKNIYSSGG